MIKADGAADSMRSAPAVKQYKCASINNASLAGSCDFYAPFRRSRIYFFPWPRCSSHQLPFDGTQRAAATHAAQSFISV
jgi:hypothetical protein